MQDDRSRTTNWLRKFAAIMAGVSAALVFGVYIALGAAFVPYALAGAIIGSLSVGWVAFAAQEKTVQNDKRTLETTKSDWIAGYVDRARAFGFKIDATPNGCVYYADESMGQPECRMVAVPCDCVGHDAGWHMTVGQE